MASLTDFIVNYGDIVQLNFPHLDTKKITSILDKHPGWKTYSPHKLGYNRFGLSVTSLDGGFSGIPDLCSLREHRINTGENYTERDFVARTNVVEFIPQLNELLDFFEPGLGRTHFIRLNKGGFFPPHRDNGAIVGVPTFRILVPINNFGINDMKWIQEEKVTYFETGFTYFVNTTKPHSVFSFVDNCVMLVLNVVWSDEILKRMVHKVVPI